MTSRLTATLLLAAAVLTNGAFAVLGSVFDYPDVLNEPVEDVLVAFRASQTTIVVWFAVMALSAALLAPIAVGVGRLSESRVMRAAVPVGIAAAAVQVIGLARWPLLVPHFAADAASPDPAVAAASRDSFLLAHRILGTAVGETLGYLLTAAWTLLVLVALDRKLARRWFTVLGAGSALLILGGVLSPLQLPVVDVANFIGYVAWSAWLVVFAVLILRLQRARASEPGPQVASSLRPVNP
jgi:hypothetical protein